MRYFRDFRTLRKTYGARFALTTKASRFGYSLMEPTRRPGQFRLAPRLSVSIDSSARSTFEYFTRYDPEMMAELRAFRRLTRDKRCLLDIGAYYGLFSLVFTRVPSATAYAFEPSPRAFPLLVRHCQVNRDRAIHPFQLALADRAGALRMSFSGEHLVGASGEVADELDVRATRVDDFVREHDIEPDVLKIDVEGLESAVLRGAAQTVERRRPVVFLEVHEAALRESGDLGSEMVASLVELGYEFADVWLRPLPQIADLASAPSSRLICRPRNPV